MDLNYTAEDVTFRKQVRTWLEQNMPRQIRNLDERKAWHRKLYEAGYVGMLWPKEYGGWGATAMQQAIVQDEMARIQAPPAINGLGVLDVCFDKRRFQRHGGPFFWPAGRHVG
jgi:alkylation response protein AidB-like acyl-CoA dehydrogenase